MPGLMRRWVERAVDPDRMLIAATDAMTEAAAVRYALADAPNRWQPGQPLKLLLSSYCGTRNTGADVRVAEIIRQLSRILGEEAVELSVFTINPELTAGYFPGVRQVELPTVYPKFLSDEVPKHHGVVAVEGSMFKSKFSNALSTMLAGTLGLASLEGKLSVGYGGEAGAMDAPLEAFVRKRCRDSLIICRNDPSRAILEGLGVRTLPGTDTAWTYDPDGTDTGAGGTSQGRAEAMLERLGWDGRQPVVAVCPINPFWWPARPDFAKAMANWASGQYREEHYKSIIFHSWSESARDRYERYMDGLAEAFGAYIEERSCFPIIVGSERLDRFACEDLAGRLGRPAPLVVADDYEMHDLVAILRRCSLVASSRYHAIVNSMPAGVPSVGITMDERIRNLFVDRGHQALLMEVDAPDLAERLLTAMRAATKDAGEVGEQVRAYVPAQIRTMGEMGMAFEDELLRVYPDFPRRDVPRRWDHYTPTLSAATVKLVEAYL